MSVSVTVSVTPATLPQPGRLGWHWIADNRRLAHSRRTVVAGRTYHVDPPIVPCWRGLHASASPLDALGYGSGTIICRVWSSGQIVDDEEGDKYASEDRAVRWLADARATLHEFGCRCAEQSLLRERAAGREPDARYFAAIACKRRWIAGEASNVEIAAARKAVRDEGTTAGRALTWDAVGPAAREAAWAAAWDSVGGASWDTVGEHTWPKGWTAAWEAQGRLLAEMLMALAPVGWEEER